jgi:hypothetical protein
MTFENFVSQSVVIDDYLLFSLLNFFSSQNINDLKMMSYLKQYKSCPCFGLSEWRSGKIDVRN